MILERIASLHIFRKAAQFESIIKSSCRFSQYRQFAHTSKFSVPTSNLVQCMTITKPMTTNHQLLSKSPMKPIFNGCQTRLDSNVAGLSSDHVRIWVIERIVSAALPIIIPAAMILENQFVDGFLAVLVVMHTHWGLDAIIVDYARPIVVGTVLPKVAHLVLNILSVATLAGLFVLIYNGPGIAKCVKKFWAIHEKKEEPKENGEN